MKLALDTNAYRALRDGHEALAQVTVTAQRVGLPIIVVSELRFGFMYGSKVRENTLTLERFIAEPRVEVLQIDDETTHRFGEISSNLRQAGTPIQQNDIWIAALCLQYRFPLATRDRSFQHVRGLSVFDVE